MVIDHAKEMSFEDLSYDIVLLCYCFAGKTNRIHSFSLDSHTFKQLDARGLRPSPTGTALGWNYKGVLILWEGNDDHLLRQFDPTTNRWSSLETVGSHPKY